jgi:hypothetical protein
MSAFSKLGYGIATQRVLEVKENGAEFGIILRRVERAIYITTQKRADGRCSTLVRTNVAGVAYAELVSIFVKLSGPLSVDYVDIKGKDLATGRAVTERIRH